MNKLGCLIGMFLTCEVCEAQNLVPNYSFEVYDTCPHNFSQLSFALPWFETEYLGADYYNECDSLFAHYMHVPNNVLGYEFARTGQAYSGIITGWGGNAREYIEVQLTDSLTAGIKYRISFFVSLSDSSPYANNSMGAYLSQTAVFNTTGHVLPYSPQIANTSANPLTSKNGWTLVEDTVTATGGEKFITIGNFIDDNNSDTINVGGGANVVGYQLSYYYIDDVSVIPDSLTGIDETNFTGEFSLFPNPFGDKINITLKGSASVEVTLFDVTSRKIFNQSFTNSTTINARQLAKGIYLYEVRNKNGVIKKGKIVKE